MNGDDKRLADLESRMTTAEENLIRMAVSPKELTFVQKYAGVLIMLGVLLGVAFGHALPQY